MVIRWRTESAVFGQEKIGFLFVSAIEFAGLDPIFESGSGVRSGLRSAMASTEGMVPITREFLARYYDNYPFDPLAGDVGRLSGELRAMSGELLRDHAPSPGMF